MKPIMSYDTWMRRTRRGPTKPRSEELKAVDYALRNYTNAPSGATLDLLVAALGMWEESKDDPMRSIRNSDGAVKELTDAVRSEQEARSKFQAYKTNVIDRASNIAAASSSASRIKQALGIFKHPTRGNVTWEAFKGEKVEALSNAFERTLEAGVMAAEGFRAVAERRPSAATNIYVKWFGAVDHAVMPEMVHKADLMVTAMKTRPITFVLQDHTLNLNYDDLLAEPKVGKVGLGYVHHGGADPIKNTLPHHTGSGMRIFIGPQVQERVLDDEYSTHTIYHELTHKVINTSDKGQSPKGRIVDVYGANHCMNLARRVPEHARQLADCWGYYACSFLKDWT